MKQEKLACSTVSWGDTPDIPRMLEEIKRAGYTGVEFQQSADYLGAADRLKTMVADAGLKTAAFYLGSSLLSRQSAELDKHRRAIDYTAALDTEVYMISGGLTYGRPPIHDDYELLAENLEKLAEYAVKQDLALSFHPHMGSIVENVEQIDMLLGLTEKTSLCPDTAHLFAAGSDPLEPFTQHAERITHVHLKDYKIPADGIYSGSCFVELGEGDANIDFGGIIDALEQAGYQDWLVVELDEPTKSAFESADISMKFLKNLLRA